mmetsp:Transcript_440/g.1222  ORF Transcript_440/g.1222 Transcript_440/m.1222 type:complete len:121 (-) Transcript_440:20-382(-)
MDEVVESVVYLRAHAAQIKTMVVTETTVAGLGIGWALDETTHLHLLHICHGEDEILVELQMDGGRNHQVPTAVGQKGADLPPLQTQGKSKKKPQGSAPDQMEAITEGVGETEELIVGSVK